MPIYNNTLDYIFDSDVMVECGWEHPLRVRKRAQKEYFKLLKQNKALIKISNRMAQILSDGEGKEDQICCVDFYHARDAVYEHAHIMI